MVASPDRWHFLAGNFSKSTTPTPVTGDQRPVFNAMCAEDFRRQSVRQLNLQTVCNLIGNVESSPEYASKFRIVGFKLFAGPKLGHVERLISPMNICSPEVFASLRYQKNTPAVITEGVMSACHYL